MSKQTSDNHLLYSNAFSSLVNQQLKDDSRFHPNLGGVTSGGMANHFPMTVMSLAGLGGSDSDIKRFIRHWPRYRAPIAALGLKDNRVITAGNWTTYLGQSRYFSEFKRMFAEEINHHGKQRVILQALEAMANSLPMGLFHPLIRLSFANMHGDSGLIADALAYFAIRYKALYENKAPLMQTLPEVAPTAGNVWNNISRKKTMAKMSIAFSGASLAVCEQLCSLPEVQSLALSLVKPDSVDALQSHIIQFCDAAVRLYLFEPALTTLHGVTAAQALAELTQSYLDSDNVALFTGLWQRYWIWLTGLYIEKGADDSLLGNDFYPKSAQPDWQVLAKMATRSNEVHTIKLVFSCKWLAEHIEDNDLYRLAATKVL